MRSLKQKLYCYVDETGQETACVEMRFSPHVYTSTDQLDDLFVDGRHTVHVGSQLLIAKDAGTRPTETKVTGVDGRTAMMFGEGGMYHLFTSDRLINNEDWRSFAKYASRNLPAISDDREYTRMSGFEDTVLAKTGKLFQLANIDGDYYAFNPSFNREGYFTAMHFYPKTEHRRVSGYLDTTRFFLNRLLAFKSGRSISRRGSFLEADWDDVNQVVQQLQAVQDQFGQYDKKTAVYLATEVIPLIKAYQLILYSSGFPPNFFFNRFTMDTGTIVNQGRALGQFKGLVSTNDTPLTPQEERGYGDSISIASKRGRVWRWAPAPFSIRPNDTGLRVTGVKNFLSSRGKMAVQELDYHNLSSTTPEGDQLHILEIDGFDLERISERPTK